MPYLLHSSENSTELAKPLKMVSLPVPSLRHAVQSSMPLLSGSLPRMDRYNKVTYSLSDSPLCPSSFDSTKPFATWLPVRSFSISSLHQYSSP